MKKLLILVSILTFFSCSKHDKYQLEDALYQCLIKHYKANNVDFEAETDTLHTFFVRKGVLNDYSAKSIWDLLQSIKQNREVPEFNEDPTLDLKAFEVGTLGMDDKSCFSGFDTSELNPGDTSTSAFARVAKEFDALAINGNIEPPAIMTIYANSLTVEDLKHPLYRSMVLLYLYNFCSTFDFDTEIGLKGKLPPLPDNESTNAGKENVFEILIGANNTLLVEDKLEKLTHLKNLTKNFIVNHKEIGIISLQNDRGADYNLYTEIQNIIRTAYKEVRNEYALKTYNKSYDELSEEQQEMVRTIYPQKISEAEPKDY